MTIFNWNLPEASSLYTDVLTGFKERDLSVAKQFDSALIADTNLPDGVKRWNSTNFNWEQKSGAAWNALATTYGISIAGTAGGAPWSGITGKPTTVAGYGITDMNWSQLAGKPTTLSGYGITDISVSSSNPVMDGTASPGSGTGVSRYNHVHPTDTSRAATGQTFYIGTTQVAINRGSAGQTLAGVNIDGSSASCTGNSATATTASKLTTDAGSAPSYSCRAWVNFDGTGTVAIRASGNVSSITDNGLGDYTVNFTAAMPDTNYVVTGHGTRSAIGPALGVILPHVIAGTSAIPQAPTVSNFRIASENFGGGAIDADYILLAIFR